MRVEQLWVGNRLRNFNYLLACEQTGSALAIDPLDHRQCLQVAQQNGWRIEQIVNTHEHHDHIGGNAPLVAATGARVLAHYDAQGYIPEQSIALRAGEAVRVGRHELEVLDTPGHTMRHICLLARHACSARSISDPPQLFSGDTMFGAGVGNCHNGGHPEELYETFAKQIETLPDDTRLYPGHDYLANNLRFTLSLEPGNTAAQNLLLKAEAQDPTDIITTLGQERQINLFLRLDNAELIANLKAQHPELGDTPTPRQVFLKLRELRNHW